MAKKPQDIADRPHIGSRETLANDALSDVLHTIHLRGKAVSLHRGSVGARDDLQTDARAIHSVEAGEITLRTDATSITLRAGEVALLPLGTPHSVSGSPTTSWVSGIFEGGQAAERFLGTLPPIVSLPADGTLPSWLPLSIQLLRQEVTDPRPGGRVMVSRILDLLLIQVLRAWSASAVDAPGLLRAALDPAIGRALSAIHADPGHQWTIEELARHALSSRSGFAAKFQALAGATPAAYLTQVRLELAADLLLRTADPIYAIGQRVGYTSEAAFSRAFRRQFAEPPGLWRRTRAPHRAFEDDRGGNGKNPDVRRM